MGVGGVALVGDGALEAGEPAVRQGVAVAAALAAEHVGRPHRLQDAVPGALGRGGGRGEREGGIVGRTLGATKRCSMESPFFGRRVRKWSRSWRRRQTTGGEG